MTEALGVGLLILAALAFAAFITWWERWEEQWLPPSRRADPSKAPVDVLDAASEITRVQYETERAMWAAATEASPARDGR